MQWNKAWDRMMEQRDRDRIVIRTGMSLAAAVVAAMEMTSMTSKIIRDFNHPKNRAKETPTSPKPRFRKGR